jgi:hypothetical protein
MQPYLTRFQPDRSTSCWQQNKNRKTGVSDRLMSRGQGLQGHSVQAWTQSRCHSQTKSCMHTRAARMQRCCAVKPLHNRNAVCCPGAAGQAHHLMPLLCSSRMPRAVQLPCLAPLHQATWLGDAADSNSSFFQGQACCTHHAHSRKRIEFRYHQGNRASFMN